MGPTVKSSHVVLDEYRETYGVEPICSVLPIAPSTYYEQKAREVDASRRGAQDHLALSPAEFGIRNFIEIAKIFGWRRRESNPRPRGFQPARLRA